MENKKINLIEPRNPKPKTVPTYETANCNECDAKNCQYREENGEPFFCPGVEGEQ